MKYQSSETKQLYEICFDRKRNKCPECSDLRKNQKAKDLQYYKDSNTAYCFHCNATFFEYKPYEKREFKIPEQKNKTKLTDKALDFFTNRRISQTALNKMKVYSDVEYMPQFNKEIEVICFPYYVNNKLINIKYRGANKSFKLYSGAELVFWNFDAILNNKEIVICEGEMDALAFVTSHVDNVVSVPNGAGNNLQYLENYIDVFDNVEKIYICTDNDSKGIELRDELVRRLGFDRCYIVDLQGKKDANDFLKDVGSASLVEQLKKAKQKQVDGLIAIDSMRNELLEFFQNGEAGGLKTNTGLDEFITWQTQRLAIVTGEPGSGKSEFVDDVLVRLNKLHNWKSLYFTPENYPLKYHYQKLYEKFVGKKFSKEKSSKEEFELAYNYIKENFFYVMPEQETSLDYILERAKLLIKTKGIKCLVIDPYNKLDHQFEKGQTETQYISKFLDKLIHFGKMNDILIILVAHPSKVPQGEKITLYSISGSAHFYNKCDYGITVDREKEERLMTNNINVALQKVKFKNLGKQGVYQAIYNYNNGRFEQRDVQGVKGWDNSNWLIDAPMPIEVKQYVNFDTKECPPF